MFSFNALPVSCNQDLARQASTSGSNRNLSADYSFPFGVFKATASSVNGPISSTVDGTDTFSVQGLAPGTPVSVTARLTISAQASAGCQAGPTHPHCLSSHVSASIREAVAGVQSFSGSSINTFNTSLNLPLTVVAGTPFDLRMIVKSDASGATGPMGNSSQSNITGTLSFIGLPMGVQVTSCGGFSTVPVATLPTSWGSLKLHYH